MRDKSVGRLLLALAGALVAAAVLAVSSDAGHELTVGSYTGCLKTTLHTLYNVAVGDAPSAPCKVGHPQVHLSGGDITAVNAGTGLTGGSANGPATLSVNFADFGSCPAGSAIRVIGTTATCETIPQPQGQSGELVLIQTHEFDTTEPYFNTIVDWELIETGGADTFFDPTNSLVNLATQESPFTPGEIVLRGRRQASVNDGTLVLKTRILDAYAEPSGAVYGNAQPRGLANGTDRSNAIEFINAGGPGATLVGCRTVAGGTATQTTVDIGQWVRYPAVYQIVATPTEARFYVNGTLFCTHTTNIPTTPLNVYYATSDGGAGNVPMYIDWVSFERRPA